MRSLDDFVFKGGGDGGSFPVDGQEWCEGFFFGKDFGGWRDVCEAFDFGFAF